jgi:hypothetical protein
MPRTSIVRVPTGWKEEIQKIARSRHITMTKYLDSTKELHKNADYLGKVMDSLIGRNRTRNKRR